MDEITPNDNTPEFKPPEAPPEPTRAVSRLKVLTMAMAAIALAVGLYFLNRFWISPAVGGSHFSAQAKDNESHPLAPDFSLTDIKGEPLKLSDYKGKVVMLDFWATWCGPCRIEIPGFVELQKRYAEQGFSVIGISLDESPEPVVDFYRQLQMNYPVAVGNDRLGELYGGTVGLPTTYLIGRDGRIYAKHVGATDPQIFETEVRELLAAPADDEVKSFHQAGRVFTEDKVELGNPAEIDSEIPGVDVTKLTGAQKDAFKKILAGQQCPCGCKFTLLKCRQVDRACSFSKKLAREQLDLFLKDQSSGVAAK